MSYGPLTYLQDLEDMLDTLGIERFVSFGTSLGGLMTMMLAAHRTGRLPFPSVGGWAWGQHAQRHKLRISECPRPTH